MGGKCYLLVLRFYNQSTEDSFTVTKDAPSFSEGKNEAYGALSLFTEKYKMIVFMKYQLAKEKVKQTFPPDSHLLDH